MTISTKPKSNEPTEAEIKKFISKGGTAPANSEIPETENDDFTPVTLRIPKPFLKDIDNALKSKPVKKPRHQWLLEAAYEKLEREKNQISA